MKKFILLCILGLCSTAVMAQNWEYINLRQYRAKDDDAVQAFVKHAYPYFAKSKRVPAVNRLAASSESGRYYAVTFFADYDQFITFLKERGNDWDEYSKSPGNLAKSITDNVEGGVDDVLWKLERDQSSTPAGTDPSKMMWRKLHFVTVRAGMMVDFLASWKKVMELEKMAGIAFPVYVLTAVYGAPNNMVLVSLPAANAAEYYTALATRQKMRQGNPEIAALRKKIGSMSSGSLIDQLTMIPY